MTVTSPPTQKTTLGIVMGILNVSNSELGRRLGINTENVRQRRAAETRLTLGDIRSYAEALNIPAHVLAMEPADVFRWFADNADTALTGIVTRREVREQVYGPRLFDPRLYEANVTTFPERRELERVA